MDERQTGGELTETHGDRVRRGHARQRHLAHPPPGRAPYGYRRGRDRYTIDRQAAPVMRAFFERFGLYGSLSDAARFLEKQYGKRITTTTARRWLQNPVYRGDLRYKCDGREEIVRDTHAPLISRDEAAQIDRRLSRNKTLAPRTASAPRSLSGLLSCGECGAKFRVTSARPYGGKRRGSKGGDYLYLYPSGCTRSSKCGSLRYDEALQATIAKICEALPQALARMGSANSGTPPMGAGLSGKQEEIDRRKAILARLPQLEADGTLDAESAALRAYNLRVEIAELEQQRQSPPPVNLRETRATLSLPPLWYDSSEVERRFYLREFVRAIVVEREGDRWWLELEFAFAPPDR